MKTKNVFFILIFLINLLSIKVLGKIELDTLVLVRSIMLEENESAILTEVSNVSTDSSSSRILVSDFEGHSIILYDAMNGKVIRCLEAPFELSDSIPGKCQYWNKEEEYVRKEKVILKNGRKLDENFVNRFLRNELYCGFFISNNEIWASAYIKSLVKPKNTDTVEGAHISQATSILRYDINNNRISQLICFNEVFYAFAWPYHFAVPVTLDRIFIITVNYPHYQSKQFDSLWIIASFSLKGELQKLVAKLPKEYLETKLGYSLLFKPKFYFNSKKELISIFPYAERIFNFTKDSYIELQELKPSNKIFLDSLKENPTLVDTFLKRYPHFLPNTLKDIFLKQNDCFVVVILQVSEAEPGKTQVYWIIQEYDEKGNLTKQYKIKNFDEHGYIHYIYYDKVKDEFLIFKLLKEKGWFIDFYKRGS